MAKWKVHKPSPKYKLPEDYLPENPTSHLIQRRCCIQGAYGHGYIDGPSAERHWYLGRDFYLREADGKLYQTYCSRRDVAPGVTVIVELAPGEIHAFIHDGREAVPGDIDYRGGAV